MGRAVASRGRALLRRLVVALFLLPLSSFLLPLPAHAQAVVDVLREQRLRARMAEVMDQIGPLVATRPLVPLGAVDPIVAEVMAARAAVAARIDSASAARRDSVARAVRLERIVWNKTEPGEQGAFLERYRETFWRSSDPRAGIPLDTTATTTLRGLLQGVFGAPTRNADAFRQVGYAGAETVQFEYWFVVNDSIPVLVMDIDGPFGRGLLLAGSESDARLLPLLKEDLFARLAAALGPDPWVDYYRSFDRGAWYRTGYNGAGLFTVEIRPPAWSRRSRVDRWNIHR
jgi:hypothetical protein